MERKLPLRRKVELPDKPLLSSLRKPRPKSASYDQTRQLQFNKPGKEMGLS